ncbi:bifunctional 4-hydroxy-2-oxoglutarate aldolase/2-dehydro-3-deoxy-phosphogluconate aldolase [Euzebya sp.]|uniref:bifunctional 4-hydroxy-2-oxoglutarate aldolase/2-dehydro-3-deoxy-phosphogluconate aldolase n=1 Tax=Euzebya sp. TaxID=1971409 RepID=UPI00351276C4
MTRPAEILTGAGIVPVVDIRDPETAPDLARALAAGGCQAIEITLRTDAAVDAIRRVVAADTGLLVGAGTVLTPAAARDVAEAGATFSVAPGYDPEVADASLSAGVPHVPGVATATEVQRCLRAGFTMLKVFPAATVGGPRGVKSLIAPFARQHITVMPTGGIDEDNVAAYLALPMVTCVGGSWLTPTHLVDEHRWDAITDLATQAFKALP